MMLVPVPMRRWLVIRESVFSETVVPEISGLMIRFVFSSDKFRAT
jgi:hypothetical protein